MPRYGVWSMPLVMAAVALILVILVSVVTGATLGGTKAHTVLQLDSTDSEEIDPWVDQPGPWIDQDQPHSAATKAASSSLETSFKKVMVDIQLSFCHLKQRTIFTINCTRIYPMCLRRPSVNCTRLRRSFQRQQPPRLTLQPRLSRLRPPACA